MRCGGLVLLVSGVAAAREPATPFEAARAAQAATYHAQAAASDARAAASEVGAQGSAEATAGYAKAAATDHLAAEAVAPQSHQAVDEAKVQVTRTEAALRQATAAEGTAKILAESAVAKGKARADADTHAALGDLFKQYEDWRYSVLHDSETEARLAAQKAEKPYMDALSKTEKRIEDMQQRADGLSGQASTLRNVAVGTANLAVAQQAALAMKDAQQNMMNAHQMMAQANDFDTQAGKMQMQAQVLQLNVPGYQAAGQMAAAFMGHRYNPDGRPPPPVNPFGFTPPPPPVNLALLQKRKQQ
jgi:hypothetical protein